MTAGASCSSPPANRPSTSRRQESKEAWLASHNYGMDRGDPRGRPDGLDRPGPADTLVQLVAGRLVGRGVVNSEPDPVAVWGRRRAGRDT